MKSRFRAIEAKYYAQIFFICIAAWTLSACESEQNKYVERHGRAAGHGEDNIGVWKGGGAV